MPLPLSVLTLGADRFKAAPEIKGVTNDAKLRETASEFEAIFIQQMLKTMRKSSFESDLLPKSEGEKCSNLYWMNNMRKFLQSPEVWAWER